MTDRRVFITGKKVKKRNTQTDTHTLTHRQGSKFSKQTYR